MRHAGRFARRLSSFAPLLVALLPGCSSDASAVTPPFISAVVIGFPGGGAPPGYEGAVVQVVDPDTGGAVTNAVVTLNGVVLPWDPGYEDYEATFATSAGGPVQLTVSVGGHMYAASATFFTAGPAISVASTVPSRCDNTVSWSAGAPAGNATTLVALLDAADPLADPVYGPLSTGPGAGELSIPPGLTPGDRLVFVAVSSEFPIAGAFDGSGLVLAAAHTTPLTVVDADYRALTIAPAYRGIGTGEALQLRATGPSCILGLPATDVTATAAWSSSDTAVVEVSNAAGSQGVATGAGNGTAVVTADVAGIRGSTPLGVRDFTRRDSTVPGEMLGAIGWTGTTLLAVGTSGTVLSSSGGVTWTRRATGSSASFTSVAASPGLVVAAAYGTSTVLTSPDLVTWTPRGTGAGDGSGLWSVIWTGDQFVAVGLGGGISTSADGLTWTPRSSGTPYTLTDVASGGSRLVAVGGYGGLVGLAVTSDDGGGTWRLQQVPSELGMLRAIAYDGARFVSMGDYWPLASTDGVTWTRLSGPAGMADLAVAPGELMTVGSFGAIASSTDGGATWITWKVGDFGLTGVTWTGTQWVIVGGYGTILTAP